MDKLSSIFARGGKFQRLAGPLKAAQVCDTTRGLADDRFGVLSFRDGLLTLSVESPAAAANLQSEIPELIQKVNQKIGSDSVKKIRFKTI